jgi:hypothetical protein
MWTPLYFDMSRHRSANVIYFFPIPLTLETWQRIVGEAFTLLNRASISVGQRSVLIDRSHRDQN